MKHLAHILIRRDVQYRAEAFESGLTAAGYLVDWREPRYVQPDNVLLLWNRQGIDENRAQAFERQGGRVIVAENGYIGQDYDGNQLYALSLNGHNGSGRWPDGDGSRWDALNIPIKPWRTEGKHILVCPNRFIGSKIMRQPMGWIQDTVWDLQQKTKRPIRVRPHPGNWQVNPPKVPLEDDLENAWACVIWSSSAGVRALVEGVPVVSLAPHWICQRAAGGSLSWIDTPCRPERLPILQKMAWAQWTLREISQGIPFICLQKS